jgi:ornithine carbamoyltransferase
MAKRDVISVLDMETDFIELIDHAIKVKENLKNGLDHKVLPDKVLGMIFEKPSLRTRVSFEIGMYQLGGYAMYLSPNEIQVGKRESVYDVAKVISRYVDCIMYRAFSNEIMRELAKHADVPVVNGLDDLEHPCQTLADLMTVKEHKGDLKGLKLTYVGDGNNVCNSLLLGTAISGMDMSVACPSGYEPDAGILAKAMELSQRSGTSIVVTSDITEAIKDADAVYTDTWVSMGDEAEKAKREEAFGPYQLNTESLSVAKPDYIVLHCLPAHRGQEITDEVMDSKHSVVFDEAENRMHAQKAILEAVILDK